MIDMEIVTPVPIKKNQSELWHVDFIDPDNGKKVLTELTDLGLHVYCEIFPEQKMHATKEVELENGDHLTLSMTRFGKNQIGPVTGAGKTISGSWSAVGS